MNCIIVKQPFAFLNDDFNAFDQNMQLKNF